MKSATLAGCLYGIYHAARVTSQQALWRLKRDDICLESFRTCREPITTTCDCQGRQARRRTKEAYE